MADRKFVSDSSRWLRRACELLTVAIAISRSFIVFVAYGVLAHAFRRAVIDSPRVQAWLRRGFASAFAGLGANLAISDR